MYVQQGQKIMVEVEDKPNWLQPKDIHIGDPGANREPPDKLHLQGHNIPIRQARVRPLRRI